MKPRLPAAFGYAIALVMLGMLAVPRGGHALHNGGLSCYACHALNAATVEPGTTSMSMTAMTELKSRGWVSGMRLGCTFCHRSVNSPTIPDVLSSFSGATPYGASRHPVARNYLTQAIDNTPYHSTDNTATAQHLDCRDCHDTTLTSYPDHDNNWLNNIGSAGRTKTTNPFGLRNVTANKAYDTFCRSCHDAGKTTFPSGKTIGKNIALASHDNGTVANPIRDLDGTNLRTQVYAASDRQCTVCHNAHQSTNLHLFSDGSELDWNGVPDNVINEVTDCTNVCHYRGDAAGNFDLHGHGKPLAWDCTVLGRNCTFCHDASQPHRRGDSSYFVKYRFTPFTPSWADNSAFQKPVKGVCATCHVQETHTTAKGQVGCIDCHDQHAKSSDNNVMMIRNRNRVAGSMVGVTAGVGYSVGTEAVLFSKSPRYPAGDNVSHFYTDDPYGGAGTDNTNPGFCDQRACHGARLKGGVAVTPLVTFLASSQHSGGNITSPDGNCASCHNHVDPGGSFRATSSCTTCHGQPPPPAGAGYTTYNENLSPHLKHAGAGYAYVCQKCHVYYTDSNYHDTLATLGYRTYQSVFFDNSVRRGTPAYDNATMRCANITCHSDGRGGAPNDNAQWFNPSQPGVRQTLDCSGCHNHDLSFPAARRMNTGAHLTHLNNGYTCSSCHAATVTDNNFILSSYGVHTDNTRNVAIRAAYDNDANPNNNWNAGTTTCSGITCHGGNPVNWVTDIGRVSCANCHARTGDVEDFGTGTQPSMTRNGITAGIDNAEWMWSGHGATPASHPGGQYDVSLNPVANLLSGGGTGTNRCAFCHDPGVGHDNAANPFRLANYNTFSQEWNGTCYVCHAAPAVGNSAPGYAPAADGSGNYVAKTAASKVANNHFNLGSTLNARHSAAYNGGKFCWDCHDPHGDRVSGSGNIFMIGQRVAMRTTTPDNVGIPAGGNATTYRPAVTFTSNVGGASYASTDNVAPYDGICEACHESASGILHYVNTGRLDTSHYTSGCVDCHTHDGGFRGAGGNNIEQFFDRTYRASAANNYDDISRHPLRTDNVLSYASEVDCLTCHGVANTDHRNNECLTCHRENRPGLAPPTPIHPNGTFEWAVPRTPGTQYGAAGPAADGFCLQCHGSGTDNAALNGVTPINVIPAGETSWAAGSGHGQATLRLSTGVLSGPPAYNCRDCHYSTAAQTGGSARDNYPPGFHGSVNRHLVRNDNTTSHEYPDPADAGYTVDQRSTRMDGWCASYCHRNATNGAPKDDNVVDHTWDLVLSQSRSGSLTHPSNFPVTPGARYKHPTNLLPYSDYVSGAMPGSGNAVCITCHNPHGGGDIRDDNNALVTPIGRKNMLRLSPSDNVSTLCKACHQ